VAGEAQQTWQMVRDMEGQDSCREGFFLPRYRMEDTVCSCIWVGVGVGVWVCVCVCVCKQANEHVEETSWSTHDMVTNVS
jgi:hypothetical protein